MDDFSAVIKQTVNMKFGAPESLLPHPKEDIKNSIKTLMNFIKDKDIWDSVREEYPEIAELVLTNRYFTALKEAYAKLGKFVSDADAGLAARANALFDNNERERIESIRSDLSSPWYKKARDLQRKLNEQSLNLLLEIEEEFGKKFIKN